MELREEFSVCLNNEALSRVRVYLYKPFYSRERENAKLRGTILSENGEINKTWNMETSQYLRRTREYTRPKRNAAYKDLKYCVFNERNKITFAIYVSLLFLPQIIPIVLLSSVNTNQCYGWFLIFQFFTSTFILFRFTHVLTTEISSRMSSLFENVLNFKIKDYTLLIYDSKIGTCWTRNGDKNVTS